MTIRLKVELASPDLAEAIHDLAAAIRESRPDPIGGELMFVVKDDHPPVKVHFGDVTAKDAEGHNVDNAELVFDLQSSDVDVLDVTPDPDNGDGKHFEVAFDSPGLASLEGTIKTSDGVLLGTRGAQFTVTAGDPASIDGGDIVVEGLTETP